MSGVNDEILHQHLKNLIEASPIRWTHAILWRCTSPPKSVLRFHEGHYRGTGKGKEVRIMGSCVNVTEEVTDAEWFFKISMSQSFETNEDLPGLTFCGSDPVWVNAADTNSISRWGETHKWGTWERAKWGHQYGIQTFLCIPFKEPRVLELASTEIIPYHPQWIKDMADFLYPIGTPTLLVHDHLALQRLLRNDKRSHERVDNEMQNRGKEKISDSRCSWPLLTQSSDRGTDRTFSYSHDYSGPS